MNLARPRARDHLHAARPPKMILAQLVEMRPPLPIIPNAVRYAAIMLASPTPICLRPF